ncbi:nucleotidyl transferase AbiEii/AbiGii toxin family protein [Patescibacteria group bacterium]|nr:nucleotidyl transferase AbiEii/AbiGii toxin family protein [Patescibacteria group bacterium]MBU4116025.1 nucleotidyl transferase AbiEii/AbiGii toxin family protein [Patescibacteria group bacterium]
MFYNILDKKRADILPFFKQFKEKFYLAGGTALALQIGHRDSVDFDFFSNEKFNTQKLFEEMRDVFLGHKVFKIQEERNTLSILVDENIKISFFYYPYQLIDNLIEEENFKLASLVDIGCMKLSAITGRASIKDYIDLYYILQDIKLEGLIEKCLGKFPNIDKNLILKSLVYFEDVIDEKIIFKNDNYIEQKDIEIFLKKKIKNILINK